MTSLLQYNGFEFVATIIHDKDILEDGTLKTLHCHAIIEPKEKGKTLKYWLDELTELLDIDKTQISIDNSNSEYLPVQYLTHKNDQSKAQYDYEAILTNDKAILEARYKQAYVKPIDPIQEALMKCNTLTELLEATDLQTTNKYRNLFKDLHQENLMIASYHELESQYKALQAFTIELLDTLALTLDNNKCRLDNWRYWTDKADKLDLY